VMLRMVEASGKCVRCDYSQADDAEAKRARGLDPPFLRVMLLVDKHVLHEGRWGTWQGEVFIRGGGRSGVAPYWVCEHCHAPGEAIQRVEKGRGL
jgi:hypothetical protein